MFHKNLNSCKKTIATISLNGDFLFELTIHGQML